MPEDDNLLPNASADVNEKGFLVERYNKWCLDNHEQIPVAYNNVGGPSPMFYLEKFAEDPDGIFDDVFQWKNESIEKNNETSINFRNQGNTSYQKKKNEDALQFYTQALLFAQNGSEALSLAYANRSAVLAQMNENAAALRDIARALKKNYPEHLHYKLYERKSKCLVALKNYTEAVQAFQDTEKHVEKSNLSDDKKTQFLVDLQTQKSSTEKLVPSTIQSQKEAKNLNQPSYKSKLPKITSPNQRFPALSKSVEIVRNSEVGRHGIAAEDIRAGELISVEDPVVSRLNGERKGQNCSFCFDMVPDFIPSPITNEDVFCSEYCLDESMSSFHPIEAKFAHITNKAELVRTEWLLALRAITRKPLTFFLEREKDVFSKHCPAYATEENTPDDFVYDSSDYKSIFNLVTLDDQWKESENHFRGFVGYFFICLLRHGNYFKVEKLQNGQDQNGNKNGSGNMTHEEKLIGQILSTLMMSTILNAHDVSQYEAGMSRSWFDGNVQDVGQSINPSLSLINHSCDPNSIHFNIGHASVSVALRDILKGEEIAECYYGFYGGTCQSARKKILNYRFRFVCQCRACTNNWPTIVELSTKPDSMKNGINLSTAQRVQMSQDNNKAIKAFLNSISHQKQTEEYEKTLKSLINFNKILHATVSLPNKNLIYNTQDFYKCLWIIWGSKKRT